MSASRGSPANSLSTGAAPPVKPQGAGSRPRPKDSAEPQDPPAKRARGDVLTEALTEALLTCPRGSLGWAIFGPRIAQAQEVAQQAVQTLHSSQREQEDPRSEPPGSENSGGDSEEDAGSPGPQEPVASGPEDLARPQDPAGPEDAGL